MSHKIDNRMMQLHQRYTQGSSHQGKKISEQEALDFIRRADEINNASSSSFRSESRRGNQYLLSLMEQHKTDFSDESQSLIQRYIQTGRIPSSVGHGAAHVGGGHSHVGGGNGHVSSGHGHVSGGHGHVSGGNGHGHSHGAGHGHGGRVPTHPGDVASGSHGGGVSPSVPSHPSAPSHPSDPASGATPGSGDIGTPATGGTTGTVGPNGTVILDFVAAKRTWACHWFPMQETRPGGDTVNNLYSVGGPLDKLDKVTGGSSRQYEWDHSRKAIDDGEEFAWWGHCNNAAEAACILQAPKHSVTMTGKDGTPVTFSRGDIQGLLVKVTPSLINRVDFKGERYNGTGRENPNDPAPEMFMSVMQEWAKDGIPFVLDIDKGQQVWNFPYDQVKISESTTAPAGFDASGLPTDGSVKFYHIDMSGTGYDKKKRVYECYVQRDSSGNVVTSGWINTPNTNNNPDFMWRPHPVGDVMAKSAWVLRNNATNPQVDPQVVYDIYMKSLG